MQKEEISLATVAVEAAAKAGEVLRKGFGTKFSISSKANSLDLVTEFDHAAEDEIIKHIHRRFPSHSFLAEESGASVTKDAPICWVIDPLDGTMNFAHHIPLFCVSIAAMAGDQVEVGVIYHPLHDELFVAERGKGAYLNQRRIFVSEAANMETAVGGTSFPYDELREQSITRFVNLLNVRNPLRVLGSCALSLAYVAAGRFDIYWGSNLSPWDVAAGKLLVEEAGGTITHFDGTHHDMFKQTSAVAANLSLHNSMLDYLR